MATVGLIDGSFKPYHAGHHALVTMAAGENDRVVVFVSLADRKRPGELAIYGSDMADIWQRYIVPTLPPNVEVRYVKVPVRAVYDYLIEEEAAGSPDAFNVYADPIDTASKYPIKNRLKYFPTLYNSGRLSFVAEVNPAKFTRGEGTPDVSGTKMRAALGRGDFAAFAAGLPRELASQAGDIFAKLGGAIRTNEVLSRARGAQVRLWRK